MHYLRSSFSTFSAFSFIFSYFLPYRSLHSRPPNHYFLPSLPLPHPFHPFCHHCTGKMRRPKSGRCLRRGRAKMLPISKFYVTLFFLARPGMAGALYFGEKYAAPNPLCRSVNNTTRPELPGRHKRSQNAARNAQCRMRVLDMHQLELSFSSRIHTAQIRPP